MAELKPASDIALMHSVIVNSINVRKRMGKDFYFLDRNINLIDSDTTAEKLMNIIRNDEYSAWFTHRSVSPGQEVSGILVYWGKEDPETWYSKHTGTIPGESYWK